MEKSQEMLPTFISVRPSSGCWPNYNHSNYIAYLNKTPEDCARTPRIGDPTTSPEFVYHLLSKPLGFEVPESQLGQRELPLSYHGQLSEFKLETKQVWQLLS